MSVISIFLHRPPLLIVCVWGVHMWTPVGVLMERLMSSSCLGLGSVKTLVRPRVFPAAKLMAEPVTCTHSQSPESSSVRPLWPCVSSQIPSKGFSNLPLTWPSDMTPTSTSAPVPWVSNDCLSGGFLVKYHRKGRSQGKQDCRHSPAFRGNGICFGEVPPILSYFRVSSHDGVRKNAKLLCFWLLSLCVCFHKRPWWPVWFSLNP